MACFAALATLLAIIGIYGVNSHSVTQRRGEIGLRMALGASPGAVMREVMGSGARLTGVGLAAGLAGAMTASALLRAFLVGISATDPLTLSAAAALLLLISAIATYFPARRAMRVNPSSALRGE
jgi:putative ABC transport system permease protein